MRYLSLFPFTYDPSDELVIDLNKPCKDDVQYAIDLLGHSVNHAYQSNFKSLLKAKFPRSADSTDPRKSGLIRSGFVPKRLNADEAIRLLKSLQGRGKDKVKRTVHPNSLCNLRPATRFTSQNRPTKPCLMSDQQIQKAVKLRDNGCSWRTIGDSLGVNSETVRSSLRRRGSRSSNQKPISS